MFLLYFGSNNYRLGEYKRLLLKRVLTSHKLLNGSVHAFSGGQGCFVTTCDSETAQSDSGLLK